MKHFVTLFFLQFIFFGCVSEVNLSPAKGEIKVVIEGVITCVFAIVWFFVLPDFPEEVKWLTEEEREFVRVKLAKDVGKSAHHIKMGWREVVAVLKDCKCT